MAAVAAAAASSVARAPSNRRSTGQKSGVSNSINILDVIFISHSRNFHFLKMIVLKFDKLLLILETS